jgi:hypothetical protein
VKIRERTDGRQVFRGAAKNLLEMLGGFLELPQLDQRSPQRDPRRHVGWMSLQSRAAGLDRVMEQPGATVLVGQCGEGDRRRVLLDPAPQLVDAGVV